MPSEQKPDDVTDAETTKLIEILEDACCCESDYNCSYCEAVAIAHRLAREKAEARDNRWAPYQDPQFSDAVVISKEYFERLKACYDEVTGPLRRALSPKPDTILSREGEG